MRASTLWDLVWAKGAEKPWQPRRTDMPLVFISLGGLPAGSGVDP
jgi:hypothetical protein